MIITILASIFVFGVCITIHEFGHFIFAKACHMKVDEFAIGMGPSIAKKRYGETVYSLRAFPFGGYNRIVGMTQEEGGTDPRAFVNRPRWQQFIVILAGALFNFILGIVLFTGVFAVQGVSHPVDAPIVGHVIDDSPAQQIHLQKNDKLLSINGYELKTWGDISKALSGHSQEIITLEYERNHEKKQVQIVPKNEDGHAILGIQPSYTVSHLSPLESVSLAFKGSILMVRSMASGLADLVAHRAPQGSHFVGPVGVAQLAGEQAALGFGALLSFTAVLSLNLGFVNLLPLPVLDGGRLVLIIIESIVRRRLPDAALMYIQGVGVALIILFTLYVSINDILRIFSS